MNETELRCAAKRTQKADCVAWGAKEFGGAILGDARRTERLTEMAAAASANPHGAITAVFTGSAEREGAYRFVENDAVLLDDVGHAAHVACFRRGESSVVFVPVDGSSLSLPAAKDNPRFGPVGTDDSTTRGVEVMSAIALDEDGTPLGVCGQRYWVRKKASKGRKASRRRLEEKETRHWLDVLEQALESHKESGSSAVPWFQLDRGGDFREALLWACAVPAYLTVRAAQDRRVMSPDDTKLWDAVESCPVLGEYELTVPKGPRRTARNAQMEVRATPVVLVLGEGKESVQVELYAVHTKEVSPTPGGEEPVEWLLLTNREVRTLDEARRVIYGYSLRWRIEEVHKTWKSTCNIEVSALEEPAHLYIWATMLFAVAVRIERLKRLARATPASPATVELRDDEIRALLALRDPKAYARHNVPTIAKAVLWIAELGGYIGKSSGGPPGAITIGRGLKKLAPVVQALNNVSQSGK